MDLFSDFAGALQNRIHWIRPWLHPDESLSQDFTDRPTSNLLEQ
jgi:hypothetical protein